MGMGHGPCQSPHLIPTTSEPHTLSSLMGTTDMETILSRALYIIPTRTQVPVITSSGGWLVNNYIKERG